jgi:ABC-type multidrug transport system ATPase subunit
MTTALSLRGLRKRFRAGLRGCATTIDALSGVDLDVHLGEVVGLVGSAGAGKSTLLLCAAGVMHPDDGHVVWFGVDHALRIPPSGIGYVADRSTYYPFLTAREALEYYTTVRELGAHARDERVAWALQRVGLDGVASRRISQLSAGSRRRIAIAQLLLAAPRLVLVDESVEEVDAVSRERTHVILRELASQGAGVLIASRRVAALGDLASRVVELEDGHVRDAASRITPRVATPPFVGRVAEPFAR